MSEFVPLEAIDRRAAIRRLALGLTAAGVFDAEAAQHVHAETAAAKASGPYKPKAFTAGEYGTLERLAELIVPADRVSGSAKEAGAAEFIDTLAAQNQQLADIFHGGLAWMDAEIRKRYGAAGFTAAAAQQQTALLDLLVEAGRMEAERKGEELVYRRSEDYKAFSGYTVHRANELLAGVAFFDWVRKMTVDAFYTSPMGIKDLGYIGNRAYGRYTVPAAAMEYAMKRSPV
jgi:hypothetical protein